MRKKIIVVLMVILVGLSGCGSNGKQSKINNETTKAVEKTVKSVVADNEKSKGCVVYKKAKRTKKDGELILMEWEIVNGKKAWNNFLQKTKNYPNEPAQIKIRQYYEKDGECTGSVLKYDGQKYSLLQSELGKESEKKYKYLVERRGKMPNAKYTDHGFYLVNDDSVTYNQLMWSLLSSNSNDWIDFQTVFTEITES